MHAYRTRSDVSVLSDYVEVPGIGFLPVNAFVVHAAQPVVSDTASLFATLLDAPGADPFTGPDQAALEAMLRTFEPA